MVSLFTASTMRNGSWLSSLRKLDAVISVVFEPTDSRASQET